MANKLLSLLLFFCFTLIVSFWFVQENAPPKVEITFPSEDTTVKWNTVVPYAIAVLDEEDGNSEYDEIDINEVILTVTYVPDASKVEKYIEEEVASRAEIISTMASSNCLTCHKAKDKLIGPSFEEIADKYRKTPENMEYMAQKISQGSRGIWGDEIMPAQPELEKEKIMQILEWIFNNMHDPNFTFYVGTEGAFKTKERPKDDMYRAVYVLHAQYVDHGVNKSLAKSKKGIHSVVLNSEQ